MKTSRKAYFARWEQIFGVTLILIVFLLAVVSCDRRPKRSAEDGPPAPEAPASDLELPDPVVSGDIEGEASLPERISLGFTMDLDGKLLGGDWSVEGAITAVSPEKVTLVSNHQKEGHLAYRLPAGLRLSVVPGEAISVERTVHLYRSAMGYALLVKSSGHVAVAAGRLLGAASQEVRIRTGLSLRQIGQRESRIRENRYETTYLVPVILSVGGAVQTLEIGALTDIILGHKHYSILVLQSSEIIPTREYEGIFEGGGYLLEYVVISKEGG